MKNLKKIFVLIALSILLLFGVFTFSPIIANAENDTNISEETVTYPMSYLFKKSETVNLVVTLIDKNTARVEVYENNALNEEITADYTLDGDIITITVNGEIYGVYDRSLPFGYIENNSGNIEKPSWLQQVYIHEEDAEHVARITLVDETTIKIEAIYRENVSGTINGEYKFIKGDVIEVWANGEWFADFQLFPNGTFDYFEENTPIAPETPEDTKEDSEDIQDPNNVLTEEQLEEVKGFIQNAYNKFKNKLLSIYLFLTGTTLGAVIACAGSIILKKCKKKIKEENTLTAEQIELIAINSATNVVKSIVGKSLNVDIQAEVSNSVKEEIAPIAKNMKIVMQSAKNAEMGTALVMKAQAKSRLISDEETTELETKANSLLAHAEKFGGLSAPIQISTEEKKEKKKQSTAVNLVETPNKPVEKKENESYITF